MSAQEINLTEQIAHGTQPVNLAGMTLAGLRDFFGKIGEQPFRAVQVIKWIHKRGIIKFAEMTDLSKALRDKLQLLAVVELPTIVDEQVSIDGTHKWLVAVNGGNIVEMVFIPEPARGTLCISSQIGCAVNCSFCLTGKQGFSGNLTAAEIIGQVWLAARKLEHLQHPAVKVAKITNVVMMGMGEPLLNFAPVVAATAIMRDENAYCLARRRVTVSTSGIVPQIAKLSVDADVALAISLHAPTDELRNELVPINKKYPIASLIAACKDYLSRSKLDSITIEYVLLKDVNDKAEHAKKLIKVLSDLACKVNLIPHNSFAGSPYLRSTDESISTFQNILKAAGIVTTVRTTRGDDILAACGQLAGKVLPRGAQARQATCGPKSVIPCTVQTTAVA